MRQYTVIFAFVFTHFNSFSQQLVTVQHNGNSAFYSTFFDAYSNCQSGDTIYLPGGVYAAGFSISKEVHIVGVGHDPDFTSATDITTLNSGIFFYNGSNYSSITGVAVSIIAINTSGDMGPSNYIDIYRCKLTSVEITTPASNNTIRECIIDNISGYYDTPSNYPTNNTFFNNIINGQVRNFGLNNFIHNNIFIGIGCCTSFVAPLYNITQSLIQNNIFCTVNTINFGTPQCTFKNNMTSGDIYCAEGICNGNIVSVPLNTIFVSYDGSGSFNYNYDFQLQSMNAGNNAGTDGTDMGIYGGDFPWKEGSVPFNPHIKLKTISTKTNSSGNLNVNITVEAQEE